MNRNAVALKTEENERRMKQFGEMEKIWKENDDSVKAYLEGCIHTAAALAVRDRKVG